MKNGIRIVKIISIALLILISNASFLYGRTIIRDPNQGCMYCHYGPTAQSTLIVYEYPTSSISSVHDINYVMTRIPFSTKSKNIPLKCLVCHTDHSAVGAIPGSSLLRSDPFGDGGVCTNLEEFCSDCHNIPRPYPPLTFINHPSNVSANFRTSFKDVNDCFSCHSEGIDSIGDFPHQGFSFKFLGKGADGNTVTGNSVDSSCLKCHLDTFPNPSRGVSITY